MGCSFVVSEVGARGLAEENEEVGVVVGDETVDRKLLENISQL